MSYLDLASGLVIRPGTGSALLLPLLPGSTSFLDTGGAAPELGSNLVAPVNTQTGQATAWILARSRAFRSWFTAANLAQWFGRDGYGKALDLGALRFQMAGEGPVQFAACKVAWTRIVWGRAAPLLVETLFMPYAYRGTPSTVPAPAPPFGPMWTSHRTVYAGVNGVAAGEIRLDNGLQPKPVMPHYTSIDGNLYPADLWNEALAATLSLDQKTEAAAGDNTRSDARWAIGATWWDPTGTHWVNLSLALQAPTRTQEIGGGLSRTVREYRAVALGTGLPLAAVHGN